MGTARSHYFSSFSFSWERNFCWGLNWFLFFIELLFLTLHTNSVRYPPILVIMNLSTRCWVIFALEEIEQTGYPEERNHRTEVCLRWCYSRCCVDSGCCPESFFLSFSQLSSDRKWLFWKLSGLPAEHLVLPRPKPGKIRWGDTNWMMAYYHRYRLPALLISTEGKPHSP